MAPELASAGVDATGGVNGFGPAGLVPGGALGVFGTAAGAAGVFGAAAGTVLAPGRDDSTHT